MANLISIYDRRTVARVLAVFLMNIASCGGTEKSLETPDGGARPGNSQGAGGTANPGGSTSGPGNAGSMGGSTGVAGSGGASGGSRPPGCLSDCGSQRCERETGKCVECLVDADCVQQGSFPMVPERGTICTPGHFCGCTDDQQCAGTRAGGKCNLATSTCGCDRAADCATSPDGPACRASAHQCGCASDADCRSGHGSAVRCDVANAQCVDCVTNADCGTSFPTCDPSTHSCVDCVVDSDCAKSDFGRTCNHGACRCLVDGECATSSTGPHCDPFDSADGSRACACRSDSECTLDRLRPRCIPDSPSIRSYCGCNQDADCPAGTKCQYGPTGGCFR